MSPTAPASHDPSRPTSRVHELFDPTLIRQVRQVSWVWFGAFVAAATVTVSSATQLKAPVWYVLPGGGLTGRAVLGFAPWGPILIGWVAALVLVTAIMMSREWTRPRRVWPMVLMIVVAVVGAPVDGSLVVSTLLQLGRSVPDPAAASRLLLGPADLVGRLAFAAALISLVVVPGVLARIRTHRRGRAT